jgi:Cu(I)/Ag(I) efflux system membrane fusion protein
LKQTHSGSVKICIEHSKKVVLSKENGFKAREIKTGIELNDFIQVLEGLGVKEAIADNAQYLMDSESL